VRHELIPLFGKQMNPSTLFRASVIAAPLVAVLAAAYTLIATPSFSQDWQDVLAWSGNEGVLSEGEGFAPADIVMMLVIIIAVGNQIALFFYWNPSRLIYLTFTILGFLATPFFGLVVSPPLEALGYELSVFISGVTLALAYFSPVAERFK
jgi:hypothetical protein